jgi:hypothetical protein
MSMRISAGIAEIGLNSLRGNSIISEKAYIWPVYHEGKVDSISGVSKRTASAAYIKPNPEDRAKLLDISRNTPDAEYNSSGKISMRNGLSSQRGSFFDAIA